MKRTVIALLGCCMSFAAIADAKQDMNVAATLQVYMKQCPDGAAAAPMAEKYLQEYMKSATLTRAAALQIIAGGEILMVSGISEPAAKQKFCDGVRRELDSFKASQPENAMVNRGNAFIEALIVGAVGGVIGFLIGLVVKLVTRKNLNSTEWWIATWVFGAVVLSRVAVTILAH